MFAPDTSSKLSRILEEVYLVTTEVLIGQSYYLRFDPKLWDAMQPYPPLGSLYAASYIRSRGIATAVFDAMLADSPADWQRAVEKHRPRFAVIYEDRFNYLSKMCLLRMREAAFEMIQVARRAGATVLVSGSDATDHSDLFFEQGADFILIGEGEITLGELLDSLMGRSKSKPEQIPGVRKASPETYFGISTSCPFRAGIWLKSKSTDVSGSRDTIVSPSIWSQLAAVPTSATGVLSPSMDRSIIVDLRKMLWRIWPGFIDRCVRIISGSAMIFLDSSPAGSAAFLNWWPPGACRHPSNAFCVPI